MAMNILAAIFCVVAVAAGVLCFVDENFLGKKTDTGADEAEEKR